MNVDRCEIVEHSPRVLGFRTHVTLRSPLPVDAAWKRLRATFPRFNVPPDIPHLLGLKPRLYVGSLRDGEFRLFGPAYLFMRGVMRLTAVGTIEASGTGSLIRLRACSLQAIVAAVVFGLMSALCLAFGLMMAFGAIAMFREAAGGAAGLMMSLMIVMGTGVMALPPIAGVIWTRSASQRQLTFLLDYLQTLFTVGNSRPGPAARDAPADRHRQRPTKAAAAARTERRIFQGKLLWMGVFGGVIALLLAVSVLLIFVVPAWQDYRQMQRMVESRCVVLDSRVTEEQSPEMESVRRNGRVEQVPTGRMISRFKPEFLVRYDAAGPGFERWAYRSPRFAGFVERGQAEEVMRQFRKGGQYPCWYDPQDPETVVLDREGALSGVAGVVVIAVIVFGSAAAFPVGMVVLAIVAYRRNRRTSVRRADRSEDDGV